MDRSRTIVTDITSRLLAPYPLKVIPDNVRLLSSDVMETESFRVPKSAVWEAKSEYPTMELSSREVAAVTLRLMPAERIRVDNNLFMVSILIK